MSPKLPFKVTDLWIRDLPDAACANAEPILFQTIVFVHDAFDVHSISYYFVHAFWVTLCVENNISVVYITVRFVIALSVECRTL